MAEETTVVGLYLALVGLLGSFFWVSLSSWVRDLVSLKARAEHHTTGAGDAQERLKVKHEVKGLGDWTTGATTLAVSAFVLFLLAKALDLANNATGDLNDNLESALWFFLTIYIVLTLFLLGRGYWLANQIKHQLK